jgi:hypothetical protein
LEEDSEKMSMSNWEGRELMGWTIGGDGRQGGRTYDILVLLGVMGDLGDGDVAADGLIIGGFPFARQIRSVKQFCAIMVYS